MKKSVLFFYRLKSHFKNHRIALAFFMIGICACLMYLIYFYGDYIKMSKIEKDIPEQLGTCTVYFIGEYFYAQNPGIGRLEDKYRVVLYAEPDIDLALSQDIINKYAVSERDHSFVISAVKENNFDFGRKYGFTDVSILPNALVLSDECRTIDINKYKETDTGVIYLDGIPFTIIGIHTTANESYTNYEYMYNNNMKLWKLEVSIIGDRNKDSVLNLESDIKNAFDNDSHVLIIKPDELYQQYFEGENKAKIANSLNALIMMAVAFFVFLFLIKYIFEADAQENSIERIVGANREFIGVIAYFEIMFFTIWGLLITFLLHWSLFDTIFKKISSFPNLKYELGDYGMIAAIAIGVMSLISIPFIISMCKKDVIETKKSSNSNHMISNILTNLFLTTIIALAIIFFLRAYGIYRYSRLNMDLIEGTINSQDALFCNILIDRFDTSNQTKNCENRMDTINQIRDIECVENIYNVVEFFEHSDNQKIPFLAINPNMSKMFPVLNEGRWFDGSVKNGIIEAVVCGDYCDKYELGSAVDIGRNVSIRIVGKLNTPNVVPIMHTDASKFDAQDIFGEYSAIILPISDSTMELYYNNDYLKYDLMSNVNFFVDFKSDVSEEAIAAAIEFIQSKARINYVRDILNTTKNVWLDSYSKMMVVPVFYVIIAMISFACVFSLNIMKRVYNNSVEYLLGKSKNRITIGITFRILAMVSVAIIIDFAYILSYYSSIKLGVLTEEIYPIYFDYKAYLLVILISVLICIISTLATRLVFNNNSPVTFWNKSRE